METADVRKRITDTIARAKREATARRARNAEVGPIYERFLEGVAVPLMQQVSSVLKAEKYAFALQTPAGTVRLASERSPEDFLEVRLDTSGQVPQVVVHVERVRGRETSVDDRPVRPGVLTEHLTDADLLDVVSDALGVLVDR